MNPFDYARGPLTGRITGFEGPSHRQPASETGWQEAQPAAATALGHGGTQLRRPLGLDKQTEAQIASALIDCLPDDADSDSRNERNQLFADWEDVNRRIRRFLTIAQEVRLADLREQLAEVKALGREALEEARQLAADANAARANFNDYLDAYTRARTRLKQAEAEKPDAEEWPTADELTEWDRRVARARAGAERAEARHTELREAMDVARLRVGQARQRLQELREQRERLQAQIDGKAYKGPHGLVVPGSGV